jgi:hypothetical protein
VRRVPTAFSSSNVVFSYNIYRSSLFSTTLARYITYGYYGRTQYFWITSNRTSANRSVLFLLFARIPMNSLRTYRPLLTQTLIPLIRSWRSYLPTASSVPVTTGTTASQTTAPQSTGDVHPTGGGDDDENTPWDRTEIGWPSGVDEAAKRDLMNRLRRLDFSSQQREAVNVLMQWSKQYYAGSLGSEIADAFDKAFSWFGNVLSGTIGTRFLKDLSIICQPASAANLVKLVTGETKHWLDEPWTSAAGWAGSMLDADGRLWLYAIGLGMDRMRELGFRQERASDGSSYWAHDDIPNLYVILRTV